MSHFTVLVIGDDYEGQLAPYNEDIQVAPYKRYESDVDWLREVYAKEHDGQQPPSDQALAEFLNEHWEDEHDYGVDDMGVFQWSTYNPDSKWDWYTVGGRWRGYFKLTERMAEDDAARAAVGSPGVFGNDPRYDADVVNRGDVDAEAMRKLAGDAAGVLWDKVQELFAHTDVPESWDTIRDRHGLKNIDAARAEYGAQERVRAVRKHDQKCREEKRHDDEILGFYGGIEEFNVPRAQYVQEAADAAICPYAYVYEGRWFAPGEMGFWGMSTDDDDDKKRFYREFNEFFDQLPPETPLTLVDCHI